MGAMMEHMSAALELLYPVAGGDAQGGPGRAPWRACPAAAASPSSASPALEPTIAFIAKEYHHGCRLSFSLLQLHRAFPGALLRDLT